MHQRPVSFGRRNLLGPVLWLVGMMATGALAASPDLTAQVPTEELVELRLHDGSTLTGHVLAETVDSVTFITTGGLRLELDRARIRSITSLRGRVVGGEYWREDPNRTRLLLLSPTARTLPQGEGYVSAFLIVLPFVGYGVTDDFTIAGGTPILPEVVGRVFYFAPKFRVVERPSFDLAVGGIAFLATEVIDEGSVGIAYGVGTFGGPDQSLSAGAGWGWAIGGESAWVSNEPLIMLGGEYRVARGTKLLTENFVVLGERGALLSGGARLFGERLSVDFGIAVLAGFDGELPWLPVLNFVYNFGGGR